MTWKQASRNLFNQYIHKQSKFLLQVILRYGITFLFIFKLNRKIKNGVNNITYKSIYSIIRSYKLYHKIEFEICLYATKYDMKEIFTIRPKSTEIPMNNSTKNVS